MTLRTRKLIVLALVGAVVLLANFMIVAAWLQDAGVIDFARTVREQFLTGTAIMIIVVLLILLVSPRAGGTAGRCPVCDRRHGGGNYCSACGSRLAEG